MTTTTPDTVGGRTVLVTGGANGIGRACVRAFAGAGATVHLVDVDSGAARACFNGARAREPAD